MNVQDDEDILGQVVQGRVTNITKFGVFVRIDNGEDGLVHISEVADEFVSDIHQFVSVGDVISVKILTRNERNKLELSIKKAKIKSDSEDGETSKNSVNSSEKSGASEARPRYNRSVDFEKKLNLFMKKSEERQIFLKRNLKKKQGLNSKKRV